MDGVILPGFPFDPIAAAETDQDGEMRLDGLPAGIRDVRVAYARSIRVEIADGQHVDLGAIRMEHMADEYERGR